MHDAAELLQSIAGLAWPILAGLTLWRLYPLIASTLRSRGFTVKVGQLEFRADELSEELIRSTAEMQQELALLSTKVARGPAAEAPDGESISARRLERPAVQRLLWADDSSLRTNYVVAQLASLGLQIDYVHSTAEALKRLDEKRFDAVISGLGRTEAGTYDPRAGLALVREAVARGGEVPIHVYDVGLTPSTAASLTDAGAAGVATTPTELFRNLGLVATPTS
jgi:CheY-like chemotaxis protein